MSEWTDAELKELFIKGELPLSLSREKAYEIFLDVFCETSRRVFARHFEISLPTPRDVAHNRAQI